MKGKKVFVGMSGGVDSSVSAALLKEQGYDVTGVFIKVWSPDWLPCQWKDERRDAMRVAASLNIPFLTFDFEEEYKKEVVDYMLEEYKKGRTPNPDVMCNKEIKFGVFLKKAREMGADYIATGHYARINITPSDPPLKVRGGGPEGPGVILEGSDKNKDQSYFLWTIKHEDLKHILFPVGGYQKAEVRALAEKYKLPTSTKKDSQGICFIGKVDMKEFLEHYITSKPGDVLNEKGEVIGNHDGAVFYTIGQRHGFTITKKTPTDEPYYIIDKNIEKNTITVSKKEEKDTLQNIHEIEISGWNPLSSKKCLKDKKYGARIRYRQEQQTCTIEYLSDAELQVKFEKNQEGVSVGQSVVIYDGEICMGGGIIEKVR